MSHQPGLTEAEWERLYQRLERSLYNVAFRYVWNSQEAQDVVQDAFLQLWSRRQHIHEATADRYVWVSVLNLSRRRRRWQRIRQFVDPTEEAITDLASSSCTEGDFVRHDEEAALHRVIDKLPEKLKSVLLLAEFSEMSYDAIAALLSIPIGTVGSRRNLALKQLRKSALLKR